MSPSSRSDGRGSDQGLDLDHQSLDGGVGKMDRAGGLPTPATAFAKPNDIAPGRHDRIASTPM